MPVRLHACTHAHTPQGTNTSSDHSKDGSVCVQDIDVDRTRFELKMELTEDRAPDSAGLGTVRSEGETARGSWVASGGLVGKMHWPRRPVSRRPVT